MSAVTDDTQQSHQEANLSANDVGTSGWLHRQVPGRRRTVRYYSSSCSEGGYSAAVRPMWTGTADFIALILKLWNVMNVKNVTKGKHKRDYTMDPVRNVDDWKLTFLGQFAEFLQEWENSGRPGLTRETFLALKQTCTALKDCAKYLFCDLRQRFEADFSVPTVSRLCSSK